MRALFFVGEHPVLDDIADLEKVVKMGKLAVTCMVEEAKRFGVNKPVDESVSTNTLSLEQLGEILEKAADDRALTV